MQQFIHISDPQGAQQQTQRLLLLLSIDGTDRQTDDPPFHINLIVFVCTSSQAQGLNLRFGWSLGGKRTVDIDDEQTDGVSRRVETVERSDG